MKRTLIGFLVLAIAFMIAAPAAAMGRVPGKSSAVAETLPTEIFGKTLNIPETAGTPVAKASLKGKPNPDPINIEGGSDSVISSGQEDNIWVYPTGDASKDPVNIQYACDNVRSGGKVRLMAGPRLNPNGKASNPNVQIAFNLQGSYIDVKEDVIIRGEKLPGSHFGNDWNEDLFANKDFIIPGGTIKSDRAVIYGGGMSGGYPRHGVISLAEWYVPEEPVSPLTIELTVEGLRFEKSNFSSVTIFSCNGVNIVDNVITNLQVQPWFPGPFCAGVHATELYKDWFGFPLRPIAGLININHNMIDAYGDDPDNDPTEDTTCWGINPMEIYSPGVSAKIEYNTIKNTHDIGIMSFGAHYSGSEGLRIAHNNITQRYTIKPGAQRWGMSISAWGPLVTSDVSIIENTITIDEGVAAYYSTTAINCTGLVGDTQMLSNNLNVDGNEVVTTYAIWLGGAHGGVENCLVSGNTISGDLSKAIAVCPEYLQYNSNYNMIAGNDYTGVTGAGYRVYLGGNATNNTVDEPSLACGDVQDDSGSNIIIAPVCP